MGILTLADLGEKRTCPNCGAKFYDLGKSPASCPKCKTTFDPVVEVAKPKRTREKVKAAPVVADDDDEIEDDEDEAEETEDEDEEEDDEAIVALDDAEPELVEEDETAEPGIAAEPKAAKRKTAAKFTPDEDDEVVEDEIEEDDGLTVIDEDDEFEDDDIELEGDADEEI